MIVGRKGGVGEVWLSNKNCWPIDTTYFVRCSECLLTKFIFFLLKSLRLSQYDKSTAIPGLNRNDAYRIPVEVPPLPEQHRIVNKVEELFSELDSGIASLKTAQQQLKRYRQAVLKAAFEGKLTAQWREEQRRQGKLESAETLLAQIKAERKRRYEEAIAAWKREVKAWEENGKDGKKPRKPKKSETSSALTEEQLKKLLKIPKIWQWTQASQIGDVSGGVTKNSKRKSLDLELPYLRVANVYANSLDLFDVHEIGLQKSELSRVMLRRGDLLIVEGNGSIDQIGRVAAWNGSIDPCVHQNHLIKLRLEDSVNNLFVLYFLLSPVGRDFIEKQAATTAGLYTLSLSKVRDVKVPLAPSAEQTKIVEEIETRLSIADRLEADIQTNLQKADALRQSILKRAFEGKLVPQDPNDEPAAALLERIRAERQGSTKQLRLDNT